jgi:hypothetical protein
MRLEVPFIVPRQLGAVEVPRRQFFYVGWRTVQSGAPPDMNSSSSMPDLLPYQAQPTVGPRVPLAHQTLSGAHRTIRCDQPTIGAGHTSPADCAADCWPRAPLTHRIVRCTPDVTEPPKVLGPPTVFLVLRTLDNPVDALNHSTSSVTVSSSIHPRALHPSHIYYITSEERISGSKLQ